MDLVPLDPVAIEADDDGGEEVDVGEDDEGTGGVREEEGEDENYSDEEEGTTSMFDPILDIELLTIQEEMAKIESDEEMENVRNATLLDSADSPFTNVSF